MIKKIIFLLPLFYFTVLAGFGQVALTPSDTVLPEKVSKGFHDKYPGKSDSLWVQQGADYIITFTEQGKWYDVRISTGGKWMESVIMINYEDLPAEVRAAFEKSEYADLEQLRIDQVETEKSPLYYKILLLSKSEDEVLVKYDSQGKVVK